MAKIVSMLFKPLPLVIILFTALVLMFSFNAWGFQTGLKNALSGSSSANIGGDTPAAPGQQCNPAPTITLAYIDALNGTAIPTTYADLKINSGNPVLMTSAGSGQISGGDSVKMLLYNMTNYPATIVSDFTVGCSTNQKSGSLYSQAAFPQLQVVGGGTTSILVNSVVGTGGTNDTGGTGALTQTLKITPAAYQATGDLVIVVDANSSTKIGSITAPYPLYEKGKPNKISGQAVGSKIAVFRVPSSFAQLNIPITFNPAAGQSTSILSVNYTVIQAQAIKDTDGVFKASQIEDSFGNNKWFNISSVGNYVA